ASLRNLPGMRVASVRRQLPPADRCGSVGSAKDRGNSATASIEGDVAETVQRRAFEPALQTCRVSVEDLNGRAPRIAIAYGNITSVRRDRQSVEIAAMKRQRGSWLIER